ncbi:phage major capsid protein [Rathayibacter sp. AY1C5]|uniref:phage major capsid protein n=1 Tax=Rathayibacter sp. AY1C5 TaxID=2080538 RepID=UPI000CE7AA87|nr:phage major capsid protein [Rathayibacter sp. AY1C5]PPG60265.1 phage major capsid protein [Rathayibacter sp. AY1C5]
MTKIQELIQKSVDEKVAAFAADVETKLKAISKDQIASKENNTDDEKDRIKSFYTALAAGDRAAMNAINDMISKDYKAKAQTVGTSNQGGILVPTTIDQSIRDKLEYVSPMRRIATVISNMPAKLVLSTGSLPTVYWVAEGAPITESGVTFTQTTLTPNKLAGLDKFTSEVLADAAINPSIQNYVEDRFVLAMALAENAAFVNGDGSGKPFGLRSTAITPTSVPQVGTTAGSLAYVDLVNLKYALGTAYRETGTFVMPSAAIQLIEKLVDTSGRPIYRESIAVGTPATLLGRPVEIVDEIPTNLGTGTNKTEIWYGNFKQYIIGDRGGLRVDLGTDADDFSRDKISLRIIKRVAGLPVGNYNFGKLTNVF